MEVPAPLAPPATGGRPSAVLVLFGDGPNGPDLLFIQRSDGLRLHAGQPAFPGGAIDDGDGGPVGAALREAAEEVGLDPGGVDVVGTLPEVFIERTGFRVVPVLAWWRKPSAVAPVDAGEVAAVERVSVAELADPATRLMLRMPSGRSSPAFRVRGHAHLGFHRRARGPAARAGRLGEAVGCRRRRRHVIFASAALTTAKTLYR